MNQNLKYNGLISSLAKSILFLGFIVLSVAFVNNAFALTDTKTGEISSSHSNSLNSVTQVSGISSTYEDCNLSCVHTNGYNYEFNYQLKRGSEWINLADANKCEEIKVLFTPIGDWGASLTKTCQPTYPVYEVNYLLSLGFGEIVPPTDFLACSGQTDCLSKATEHSLMSDTFGRGVQQVPADFVANTEKSLTSADEHMECSDGICVSYTSGDFTLNAKASASTYYGQCRGYGVVINTPGVAVPEVTSTADITIANRAPVPTVTFAKNPININEEVDVTCDIVDPDECSDKIAKVEWTCTDSYGKSDKCFIWKADTGVFTPGGSTQTLVPSEQSNPYRATAKFKASQGGTYAVTCEATDNDANNPLSGTGIAAVEVTGSCGEDGICNPNCTPPDPDCTHCGPDGVCVQGCVPPDPDCSCGPDGYCNPVCTDDPDCTYGQIPAHGGFCAVIPAENGSSNVSICENSGSTDYEAYTSGIDVLTYKWRCFDGDNVKETSVPRITCNYGMKGTFAPALSVVSKSGTETQCATEVSTSVNGESTCQVELRIADTNNNFSKNVVIAPGEIVEATLDRNCLVGGTIEWNVTNGTIMSQDSNTAKIKFNNNALTGQISAKVITTEGKTVNCGVSGAGGTGGSGGAGGSNVEIKEKVQFGTQ